MSGYTRIVTALLVLAALGIGCRPGESGATPGNSAPGSRPVLKRITLGMLREPDLRPNATGPQRVVLALVQSGLTARGAARVRYPRLAEAVPSLDNGLWKLLPDGRMETTWRLRDGARWHDGVPVTSDDLQFSLQVGQDREMSAFNAEGYASIE